MLTKAFSYRAGFQSSVGILLLVAGASQPALARDFSGKFQFKNGNTLVYEMDHLSRYSIKLLTPSGEEKRLRTETGLEAVDLTEKPSDEDLGSIRAVKPVAPEDQRTFAWFQDTDGQFLVFDDGTLAPVEETGFDQVRATLVKSGDDDYAVESFHLQSGSSRTTIRKINYEQIILDAEFHPELNTATHTIQNGILTVSGITTKVQMGKFLPIPSWTHAGQTYELQSIDADSKSMLLVRQSDGMSMKVPGVITDWDPSAAKTSLKDGLLRLPSGKAVVDLDNFAAEVRRTRFLSPMARPLTNSSGHEVDPLKWVLENFEDLVEDARQRPESYQETVDPGLIRKIAEGLYSRKSIMLLGKAGTGKSVTVRAFARAVAEGKVPGVPRTTKIFEVSPYVLASGTSLVGQIELKVSSILAAARSAGWVFFFDETHSLAGTGTHSEQSNDVTQYIKGALEKRELTILGTDTEHEFFATFGKDPAFLERFEKIRIEEPKGSKLIEIAKHKAELEGEVPPSDEVLQKAVEYSTEYELSSAQPRAVSNLLIKLYSSMAVCKNSLGSAPTLADLNEVALAKYKIPPSFFNRCEALSNLEKLRGEMDAKIIGHAAAKDAITSQWAIKLGGVGGGEWVNSVLLVGPPGVGKSALAKASASEMGYDSHTIEMNKFAQGHLEEFRREIYNALLRSPFQVFILDEFEKAAVQIQEAALSILQSGTFTVNEPLPHGGFVSREVNAKHCMFILTTNSGAEAIERDLGRVAAPASEELVPYLAGGISESILSRIRQIVPMHRPTEAEYRNGIKTALVQILRRESKKASVHFVLKNQEDIIARLSDGYQRDQSDFRNIGRALLGLESAIAQTKLGSDLRSGETVEIDWNPNSKKRDSGTNEAWKNMYH